MKLSYKSIFQFSSFIFVSLIVSWNTDAQAQLKAIATIEVKNKLNFPRKEVVSLSEKQLLVFLQRAEVSDIRIKKADSNEYTVLQWVDYNQDGIFDTLLFMAEAPAKGSTGYEIIADGSIPLVQSETSTYSRFVPERTDDYNWENDKVAFRTYGPDAQMRIEQKRPDGTLSSGIDLWLKRTDKSIINKWYAEHVKAPGYYHIDHGEGYDPYHVGGSRGTGGSGIWENNTLYVSKNFVSYRTIAVGPLRTVFELNYAPYSPYAVKETKRISLDLGSNFSKFEISFNADSPVPNITTGITLHDLKGDLKINKKQGWFRHVEMIDGSLLGEGIIMEKSLVADAFKNVSSVPDQSQLLVVTKPKNNSLSYYAGFAWQKSGQITSAADWDTMLQRQAEIISCPLKVVLKINK